MHAQYKMLNVHTSCRGEHQVKQRVCVCVCVHVSKWVLINQHCANACKVLLKWTPAVTPLFFYPVCAFCGFEFLTSWKMRKKEKNSLPFPHLLDCHSNEQQALDVSLLIWEERKKLLQKVSGWLKWEICIIFMHVPEKCVCVLSVF